MLCRLASVSDLTCSDTRSLQTSGDVSSTPNLESDDSPKVVNVDSEQSCDFQGHAVHSTTDSYDAAFDHIEIAWAPNVKRCSVLHNHNETLSEN